MELNILSLFNFHHLPLIELIGFINSHRKYLLAKCSYSIMLYHFLDHLSRIEQFSHFHWQNHIHCVFILLLYYEILNDSGGFLII